MKQNIFKKLEQRESSQIEIKPLHKNDLHYSKLLLFLQQQKYLNSKKIIKIIDKNFIPSSPIGYIMLSRNDIVGFLGTIYSSRNYNKKIVEQCYLHTWIVAKEFRFYSYKLIMPVLENDCFLFTYNPIKQLEGLYQKFGFEKILIKKDLFFLDLKINFFKKRIYEKLANVNKYYNFLNIEQKKVFDDHKNKKLIYFFFKKKFSSDYIFIIGKKSYKKLIPVFEILYNSNDIEFKENLKEISFEIFKECKNLIFLKYCLSSNSSPKNKTLVNLKENTLFVKNHPTDFKFDVLYSELV